MISIKNFSNDIYNLISLYFKTKDIPALLLYLYINCLLHVLFYLFGVSNSIVFGCIILGCFFYFLFYKKFRKIDPKFY
jgi:hypothetical protein